MGEVELGFSALFLLPESESSVPNLPFFATFVPLLLELLPLHDDKELKWCPFIKHLFVHFCKKSFCKTQCITNNWHENSDLERILYNFSTFSSYEFSISDFDPICERFLKFWSSLTANLVDLKIAENVLKSLQ